MITRRLPRAILFIFANIFTATCHEKGSLTYVIDNTLSMTTLIKHVKYSTETITKAVFEEKGSQIENMVLVTFNDPYAELETVTSNRNIFKSKINAVEVHNKYNNWDCPEMSMTGLSLALENSLRGSFIYLFTDSAAKDYYKQHDIIRMCQDKSTQVIINLIYNPNCAMTPWNPNYLVYHDVATACAGMVFEIGVDEIPLIFKPIKDEITDKNAIITSKTIPAQTYSPIQFMINNQTEYAKVTVSSRNVVLAIRGPRGYNKWTISRLLWINNVKIVKLNNLRPGRYIVVVGGESPTTVTVVGKSSFGFQYGFSDQEDVSIKDTSAQPIANAPTRLFISVNDSRHGVHIISAQLLDMNERVLAKYNLPLTQVNNNVYTTLPFLAPSDIFKVAVFGKDPDTDKDVRYIARFPVTPQPARTPPRIKSVSSTIFKVVEGKDRVLRIPCEATGEPKPTITWSVGAKTISPNEKYSIENGVLVIKDPTATDAQTYVCEAKNVAGSVRADFQAQVYHAPKITGDAKITVTAGTPGNIKCTVARGFPVPTVNWQFMAKGEFNFKPLTVTSDIVMIPKIEEMHAGHYECVAHNVIGNSEHVTVLIVQAPPRIRSVSQTIFKAVEEKDRVLKIPCDAMGEPKPTVTWSVGAKTISSNGKYSIENGVLVIKEPTASDSQTYVCEAKNVAGSVHAAFQAQVYQAPKITGEAKMTVTMGTPCNIQCTVSRGVPAPTISWQFMARGESNYKPLTVSGNILSIPSIEEMHAGHYKCVAHNVIGNSEHVTVLIVQVRPNITSDSSRIFNSIEGKDTMLSIPCTVTGLPKPVITWTKEHTTILPSEKYSIKDDALVIKGPTVSDTGTYKCEARNNAGSTHALFQAKILQKPVVTGENSMTVKAGETTAIKCIFTKGVPTPNVKWKFMAVNETKFTPLENFDSVFLISNTKETNAGRYKCIAQNIAGEDEHETVLILQVPPNITSDSSIVYKGIEGKDLMLKIPCTASGLPRPTITWIVRNETISTNEKYFIEDGALVIRDPTVSDSKTYVCEAKNGAGSVRTFFKTEILQAPIISGESSIVARTGTNASITCTIIKGVPAPRVTWQFLAQGKSMFTPLSGNDNILHITHIDVRHSGRYKCIARNTAGDDEHLTVLTVQDLPNITSNTSTIYSSIEGKDKILRIPCMATGLPKPTIKWTTKDGIAILPSEKYMIEDEAMIIRNPTVNDTQTYVCEAKNEAGSTRASFQAQILQTPAITGENSMTVKSGSTSTIKCSVVSGVPVPEITWQFMANNESKFSLISESKNQLNIPSVDKSHAGRYKCVAHNIIGDSEHVTTLIVEFAPIITSNNSMTYEGLEGDVALRIPCETLGVPSPVNSWSVNGTTITVDTHYFMSDGALVIKDPKKTDTGLYKCEATNYLGSAHKIFDVNVEKYLADYGTVHEIDINRLEHPTYKLSCGNPGQSVRWFIEEQDLNVTGNDFILKTIGDEYNGNYTCRVSDIKGAYTKTYRVMISSPPRFMFPFAQTLIDWNGSPETQLDCSVEYSVKTKVKWTFNETVLSNHENQRLNIIGWGHYTCSVSNVFGEVHRSFDVMSSRCLIPTHSKGWEIPLILSTKSTWTTLINNVEHLIVESGNALKFSCPNDGADLNNLKSFPTLNEIIATCEKQDTFIANGKPSKLADLGCDHKIMPTVVRTNKQCLTNTSELIRVGYNVSEFLETYEVCYDTKANISLYSRVLMPENSGGNSVNGKWYQHPAFSSVVNEGVYTCDTPMSTCCYTKAQLVNAQDLKDGPSYNSAFIDPLNAIPLWRPCDGPQSPWEEIQNKIRSQLDLYTISVSWFGTHGLQKMGAHVIPRYLWKIIDFEDYDSIAVAYLNGLLKKEDQLGEREGCSLCADGNVPWLQDFGDHVYCCDVKQLREAFGLQHIDL